MESNLFVIICLVDLCWVASQSMRLNIYACRFAPRSCSILSLSTYGTLRLPVRLTTLQVDAKNACCHQQHTLAACLSVHFLTRVLDKVQSRLQMIYKKTTSSPSSQTVKMLGSVWWHCIKAHILQTEAAPFQHRACHKLRRTQQKYGPDVPLNVIQCCVHVMRTKPFSWQKQQKNEALNKQYLTTG